MKIDKYTLRDLEIFKSDENTTTVFDFIDKTKTAGGNYRLREMFLNPPESYRELQIQQDAIRYFTEADEVSSAESRELLLSHATHMFEEDAQDMRSYAMKHEALRRALQNRNEEDAYRRSVIRIVGGRGVSVPWPEDREI